MMILVELGGLSAAAAHHGAAPAGLRASRSSRAHAYTARESVQSQNPEAEVCSLRSMMRCT